ncbi:hypothetical protein CRU96_11740 [Malaciobacter halophilus]|nr:protein kinase [Malaciobacter halophilus]RYA22682.1 hypothetical protein CRU96_11740 [Malaciobacter halophilus]
MITKNYKLIKKLEFSQESDFFLAQQLNSKEEVFIKTNKEILSNQKNLEDEYLILQNLKHENIIKAKKVEKQGNKYFLILENFSLSTLKHQIKNLI